jgi:hypothetical protein
LDLAIGYCGCYWKFPVESFVDGCSLKKKPLCLYDVAKEDSLVKLLLEIL